MSKIPKYSKIMQRFLDALGKMKKAAVTLIAQIFAAPVKKKSPGKASALKKVIKDKKKPVTKSAPTQKKTPTAKKPTVSKTKK